MRHVSSRHRGFKKKISRAVDRNRLKRLARESFRNSVKDLPDRDYLIYFRAAALDLQRRELAAALARAWKSFC
ncbi:MAG TPA: hypothetical protein DF383_07400 [Deltaproteobacteria bacterium]|nr:hypothetical protein [Deltaproteobacteria bacterium]